MTKCPRKDIIVYMARKSTAKKIKDLNNYAGEVGLFELSKQVKKGGLTTKFVIVARFKPSSGSKNTTVWLSDEKGVTSITEPIAEYVTTDMNDALDQFGFNLA